MDIYELCCYFLIYSFIGWVIEVVYHAVTLGKVVNRGFLCGPVCPVYGFGMGAVLMMTEALPKNPKGEPAAWAVFLGGMALTTMVELIAGWLLDKLFHARWWDYRDVPFNLGGYICVKFSLIWGMAVTAAVKLFHPAAEAVCRAVPVRYGFWVLLVLYLGLSVDAAVTAAVARGLGKRLVEIEELDRLLHLPSDALSEVLAENTFKAQENLDRGQLQARLARAELRDSVEQTREELSRRRSELLARRSVLTSRLLRAFPRADFHGYQDQLRQLRDHYYRK